MIYISSIYLKQIQIFLKTVLSFKLIEEVPQLLHNFTVKEESRVVAFLLATMGVNAADEVLIGLVFGEDWSTTHSYRCGHCVVDYGFLEAMKTSCENASLGIDITHSDSRVVMAAWIGSYRKGTTS